MKTYETAADAALRYLSKDILLHMGMIAPINKGTAEIISADESGVLLRETKSDAFMLSVEESEKGLTLIGKIPDGKLFAVHQHFMVGYTAEKYGLSIIKECLQAVYFNKNLLPESADLDIKPLGIEYLDTVYSNYQDSADFDYVKRRLADGAVFGGFIGGTLCGFVGTHEEGSIGILHVLDKYRGNGYGSALTSHMANLMLRDGCVPFGQIDPANKKSLNLHKRLGFEISDTALYWLF